MNIRNRLSVQLLTVVVAAMSAARCQSSSSDPGGRGGNSGSTGGTSGVGGAGGTVGSGGSTGAGGADAGSGMAGNAGGSGGSTPMGGRGGATGGTGGVDGGAGAGGGGSGGTAGSAGSPDGGTSSPAAPLDRFRFEAPCKPGAADHLSDMNCNVTPETDRQQTKKTMGGNAATVYDVTFHVRGLTEPCTYTGGMLDQQSTRFYTGGKSNSGGYTSYMMTVGDPAQHYFFNYNGSLGHMHFVLDYMVTIKIRGGTTVTFDVSGAASGSTPDGHEVSNFDMTVVPGVPPAPAWYDGQFIQLDVVSTVPAQ